MPDTRTISTEGKRFEVDLMEAHLGPSRNVLSDPIRVHGLKRTCIGANCQGFTLVCMSTRLDIHASLASWELGDSTRCFIFATENPWARLWEEATRRTAAESSSLLSEICKKQ